MKKIITILCIAVMALSLFAGCGQKADDNNTAAAGGTVSTDGSTSMEKVIGALGESFMEANSGTTFTYNPTGSGSGIQAVSEGRCDIGLSSRALKDDEKASGLKETTLALDGIAIIVNPQNPVKDLSLDQLAAIYSGKVRNWKELGGQDGAWGPTADEKNRLVMDPDEAYIAGLLHDIGKVFFASSRPDLWEAMENIRNESRQQYFEIENTYWSMDHALMGAVVLYHWKLPLILTEPINWHHAPDLAPTCKMEARLLAIANIIARNEPDANGNLCKEAVAFLPENCDLAAIGTTVAQCLASSDHESFTTLSE